MKLYFSTDYVRHSIIANADGQVMYKVNTPFKFLWQKCLSTVWKIAPSSEPLSYGRGIDSNDAEEVDPEEAREDANESDPMERTPEAEDGEGNVSDGERLAQSAMEEFDMRDRFVKLATIEWRYTNSSMIKWLGTNGLGTGEFATADLLKRTDWRGRRRVFIGCDDRTYEWELGMRFCKLHLVSGTEKTQIARYHRYKSVLVHGKDSQSGYLEFDDQAITKALGQPHIPPDLFDMFLVTFLYAEKRRRNKE